MAGNGRHWFVILKNFSGEVELFDSLGNEEDSIVEKLKKQKEGLCHFNKSPVQGQYSNCCGEFVVYFCILRFFNWDLSLEEFLNDIFTDDKVANEAEVIDFIKKI